MSAPWSLRESGHCETLIASGLHQDPMDPEQDAGSILKGESLSDPGFARGGRSTLPQLAATLSSSLVKGDKVPFQKKT
jgi:hypothetical protein